MRWLALAVLVAACRSPQPVPPSPSPPSPAPVPTPTPVVERDAGVLGDTGVLPPPIRLKSRGVNLSGAEFVGVKGDKLPGVFGVDYTYPTPAMVDYFTSRGVTHFRLPFRHERLQPTLKGPLDEVEWSRLLMLVAYIRSKGATVAIVPHNSARHFDKIVTESDFGNFWGRVAVRLKDLDGVWLGLTNEPHDMPTEAWVALANAALKEIRLVGFKGAVLVPGSAWDGVSHWAERFDGYTPNSVAMLNVVDPGANLVIEGHLYMDPAGAGSHVECVSPTIGVERLTGFIGWLRANKKIGYLGEIGAINTPTCKAAVTKALELVEANYDVWTSWVWWNAGSWSSATSPLSVGPTPEGHPERPQLAWLKPFLHGCGR